MSIKQRKGDLIMSRILRTGENQITQSYQQHYDKVHSGNGWAIGVDVVKKNIQTEQLSKL